MAEEETLIDWLSIRLASEINRTRFYSLMERFASPAKVFGAPVSEIAFIKGFDQAIASNLLRNRGHDDVKRHIDRLRADRIHVVTRDDADYPDNLAKSSLGPPLLFVKGNLVPQDKYSIAIVGSRHATQYGRAVAREIGDGLARCGMTVVSGFARGVDGEAHNAAMKAGGRTIAVLGNGLDICYPSEHRSMVERVAESGALITEYPFGVSPEKYNFPERNHVIATLSLGTLVVEAAEKSGSLITARLAVEENRFIFAVPGDITRNNSRGANGLIQQGAKMVQRSRDILVEMKHVLRGYLNEDMLEEESESTAQPSKPKRRSAGQTKTSKADASTGNGLSRDNNSDDLFNSVNHDDRLTGVSLTRVPAANMAFGSKAKAPLTDEEKIIMELLHHEAMVFDEIATCAFSRGIDVPRLTSLLMKLELRQVIRQLPGRYYVLFG